MADLFSALTVRYPSNAYALFREVPNGTGSAKTRSADAIAIGLWPSRGLTIEGFEFKCQRSDWLRELKSPEKADAFCRFCDRWWIVISEPGIAKLEELPPTWGLLVLKGEKLVVAKKAPDLQPIPVDRAFLCGLARAVAKPAATEYRRALQQARDAGFRDGVERTESRENQAIKRLEEFANQVRAFEDASGLQIRNGWGGGAKIGEIVKDILCGRHARERSELLRLRKAATAVIESLDRELGVEEPHGESKS